MFKKYLLVFSLLSFNHIVVYAASAGQGQSITDQAPLTDQEKKALLEFLNKRELLTFTGEKGDILGLVPGQVTLEDQSSTLSEYIKLSLEQNSPVISIFNDNGTYYSGAAIINGKLPKAKKEDKYILNLRELLSPSGQSSAVATGSTQAAAVTNQGPQNLELLPDAGQSQRENLRQTSRRGQGPVRPPQKQPTLFATTLVPQNPPMAHGHGLYPQRIAGAPLSFPLFPFGFQQPNVLEMQAARIAEQERQIQAARIAAQQRQIDQLTGVVEQLKTQMQAQQQAALLPQQEPSTRFEFQGPSLLTSEEMNLSGEQSQASTDRATYRPVKQAMSPDDLKDLILKKIPDADLIAMGVTAFDIAKAKEELAQEPLRELMIDQNKQKKESTSLQEEQDRALALELQKQEEELARTQQAQSATQQPVESDEESAGDQVRGQQTGSVERSHTEKNRRKREMQKAAKARRKEKEEKERQALEEAKKEQKAQEEIERAQKKAQEDQAAREASARFTEQRLEEVRLAQSLEKPVNLQGQDSSKAKKPKKKGGQLSADSAALQAEKDREDREFLEREAARNAKEQPAKILKKQDPQTIMKKILGDNLYNRMNRAGNITGQVLEKLFKAQQNENNDFETRMEAARAIIKGPYSDLFNKGSYKSEKEKAINEAIEMVTEGGYFEGIEAAIQYYLNQSSLKDNDKKRLEYLMRHAKEECLLPDEPTALEIRDKTVQEIEAKVQEKLKPQDSASILKSLKGQQQPKTDAQIVVDQFNQGLTRWAQAVLVDSIKGYKLLNENHKTLLTLIQELNWWTVSLGALIGTHAQSTELQKRLDLMHITDVYVRLFNAVILSAGDKPLNQKAKQQLNNIRRFLSNNVVKLDQGHGQLQETDTKIEAKIQGKLMSIKTLIEQSNELLKTSPDFFRNLLTGFQNDLVATQNVIYDDTKVQFTPQEIKEYTQKLNDWLEPLNYLFDIPHDKLSQNDLNAQFSQFYACIRLLRKMINAAETIPALEQLFQLTEGYIQLLEKAQHLSGQQDFELVDKHVRSFKETIEGALKKLRMSKTN